MKKNLIRLFRLFIFCMCCLSSGQLFAQGSISSNGGKVTITFDGSTPGILNGSFTATNITSSPAAGELDSDGVNIDDNIPGTADVPAVFGTNDVRFFGPSSGNVSSSVDGIWAFDVLSGSGVNRALGFQPGTNGWANKDSRDGQIVFKFVNNSGVTLTAFRIQYDIFEANDGDRNSVIEAYLTTNVSTPAYGAVRATHTTAGPGNFSYSWSSAKPFDFSVTSGLSVPNGGAIYLRFYIYDGPAVPGSFPWRDEFAIDNISIIGANNADLLDQCDAPVAHCKNSTVLLNSSGTAALAVASINNGSTADCGLTSMTVSPNSFNCSNVGSNMVTLSVTDIKNNTSTCTATVTVADVTKPSALCKNVTVQLDASGNGSTTASAVNNGSSDACGVAERNLNKTSFNCSDVGPNTVILIVTDYNSNINTCNATVTVVDQVKPSALCKNVTVQLDAGGNGSTTAGAVNNGSSDACGIAGLVVNKTAFNCSNIGANTVTLTVTDNNGNASTCSATVTVKDNVAPESLCQDVTVQLNATGAGSTAVNAVDYGSNDACGIQSIVLSRQSFSCADVGANPVTLTVTDNNGNTSTCSATATVEDNVAPEASCQDVTVQLDASGAGSATANAVDNGSNDACGIQSTVLSQQSFSCADVGANTVTLTVTDNNNNTSTCTAIVTVEDNILPIALCKNLTVDLDVDGNGQITPQSVNAGSYDNCGIQSMSASRTKFDCYDVGIVIVTLTVTDVNNNSSTCTSGITVLDPVLPEALCQDVTVQLNAAGVGSTTANGVDNGSNDACGIASLSLSETDFGCADVGPNTVTLTVTDNNGNASTCSATVTVEDHIAPIALCQDMTVQLNAGGAGSTAAAAIDNGSNDACGIASLSLSGTDFGCADVGTNTVTLTATDNNGNASTCLATVTVEDNVDPIALCRNVTVQLDGNGNGATTATAVDNGSSDACGLTSLILNQTAFDCGNTGANAVTLTVTDNNGNSSTCSAIVTVEDNVDPIIDCNNLTVRFNSESSISLNAEALAIATDNCSVTSLTADLETVPCAAVGEVIPVRVTAADPGGNTAACISYVTVTGLPCGWMSLPDGIGCTAGSEGSYDPGTESFTLTSEGCNNTPSASADQSGYIKYELCGDGSITAHVAGLTIPGFAGIVMRESEAPGAKKVAIAYQGASALARYVRYTTGGMSYPSYFQAFGARWMRIVRTGNLFKGYYSLNGVNWVYAFAVTVPMEDCIQVGLMAWSTVPNKVVTATFDHVVIDPPYGSGLPKGLVDTHAGVPVKTGTESPGMELWPNPSSGLFNLSLDPAWAGGVTIKIADGTGRVVAKRKADATVESRIQFDLSNEPPGVYLVRVESEGGGVEIRRVVIAW